MYLLRTPSHHISTISVLGTDWNTEHDQSLNTYINIIVYSCDFPYRYKILLKELNTILHEITTLFLEFFTLWKVTLKKCCRRGLKTVLKQYGFFRLQIEPPKRCHSFKNPLIKPRWLLKQPTCFLLFFMENPEKLGF